MNQPVTTAHDANAPLVKRGYHPGCIGRMVELQTRYYAGHAGFGLPFEAKIASELAEFCLRYNPQHDGLWLLMHGDEIEGSIVIDGHDAHGQGAHLRWFMVSDRCRGSGQGRALLDTALRFVDERGYTQTYLWTFASLDAARHLYERAGFVLVEQSTGDTWGRAVTEQRFVRLRQPTR